MVWHCHKLHRYWTAIFQLVNGICSVQVPLDPKLAVLGIIPAEILAAEYKLLWTRALYIARKLILQKWLSPSPSTTSQGCEAVNTNLRKERTNIQAQAGSVTSGCPQQNPTLFQWFISMLERWYSYAAGINVYIPCQL